MKRSNWSAYALNVARLAFLPLPFGSAASLCSCSTTTSHFWVATFSRSFQSLLAVSRNCPRSEAALRAEIDTS